MPRAVVTGALGFLGRHLVPALEQAGVEVCALARRPPPGEAYIAMGDAPWSAARLSRIFEAADPDMIFHLAGTAAGSLVHLWQVNLGLANAVIEAVRNAQMRPLLVCCGSAAEYGASIVSGVPMRESDSCVPLGPYGATKLAQTNTALAFAEETGTRVLVARIFNPIGPGMPTYLALGEFARQVALLRGCRGILATGNIDVQRDFIDVRHVVQALINLVRNVEAEGVVNVCSGRATSLRKLVEILIEVSGKNVVVTTSDSRRRADEPKIVIGSTAHLGELGALPPPTDFRCVVAQLWRDAERRWAGSS